MSPQTLADDYVTVAEAAAQMRVAPSTIRRWIRAGDVVAYRLGPRRIALKRADLATLVTAAPARTTAEQSVGPLPATEIRPPTHEEWERGMAALERAERLSDQIHERRGGVPFLPAWETIAEMRDERTRQLMSALDD